MNTKRPVLVTVCTCIASMAPVALGVYACGRRDNIGDFLIGSALVLAAVLIAHAMTWSFALGQSESHRALDGLSARIDMLDRRIAAVLREKGSA